MFIRAFFFFILFSSTAQALTPAEANAMASGETDTRIEALNKALAAADDRTSVFIQALIDDEVKVAAGRALIVRSDQALDPATGAQVALPADAEDVINNNRMRSELDNAMASLRLFSKDEKQRAQAIHTLRNETDDSRLPLIEKALAAETSASLKEQLGMVRASVLLNSADKVKRMEAARLLGGSNNPNTKTLLIERIKVETEADVKSTLEATLRPVESSLAWGDKLGAIFSGIS
ncbi:MAG: urea ABC transporter permease subunit UrtB, partial [Ramlibacter sp.]|nr:urea ABC transporter permease subunit UrtB [Ramlibacter sp.]